MHREAWRQAGHLAEAIAVLAALGFLGAYLWLVARRLPYPYELEWMEGAHVDYVRRLLAGQPIYGPPSLAFTPFIYTPFYFYLSALVARLTGFDLPGRGFFPLRLVSVVASAGCLVLIFSFVGRETRNPLAAFLASGLFIATFFVSGACLDIARIDTLFLFLVLLGAWALREARSLPGFAAVGLLFWLAFFTKQSALFISLPLMAWALWANRRGGLVLGTVFLGLVGASTLVGDLLSGGWYRYYVFTLPGQHAIIPRWLLGFWVTDLLSKVPVALAMAGCYLAFAVPQAGSASRPAGEARGRGFHAAFLLATLGGAWLSRLNEGAVENVLLPAYAGLSVLFGLGFDRAQQWSREEKDLPWLRAAIALLCALQFGLLRYPVARLAPTLEDRKAWDRFMRTLAGWEGEVYLPDHGYLTSLLGKPTHAHLAAVRDVLIHKRGRADDLLLSELRQAMSARRFRAIVLDDARDQLPGMKGNYRLAGQVFAGLDDGFPVSGRQIRPQLVYVPEGDTH